MPAFWHRRWFRICRMTFRWIRICVWLALLALVAFAGYLHWTGLPGWIKNPILAHLRERGFQVDFTRMRLGWGPAVIVDNASFRRISDQPEPKLSAEQAEMELTLLDLARAKVAVKAIDVTGATLRFPPAGQASNSLSLDNIQLALFFPETNSVRLTNASATFRGVRLIVNGELDHAEAVRHWAFLRPGRAKKSWQALLDRVTDILDQIHFAETPRIVLDFSGDARDLDTAKAHLSVGAPGVSTPWGDARKILLEADCRDPFSTNSTILQTTFNAEEMATPWAQGAAIHYTANFSRDSNYDIVSDAHFRARELNGSWGTNFARLTRLHWDGSAGLNGTNFHILYAGGNLQIDRLNSSLGAARSLRLNFNGQRTEPATPPSPDWGFWRKLAGYTGHFDLEGDGLETAKLKIDAASVAAEWSAPQFIVSNLNLTLYGGKLAGQTQLDVATREVTAAAEADFDERRIARLLTPAAQRWLSQFEWTAPPKVHGQIRLQLPPWTNRPPEWTNALRQSVQIAGDFKASQGTFRGVAVDRAQGRFGYTNRVWTLPDFEAWRGDGKINFAYSGSEATHDFHFLIDSALDPADAQMFLPEAQRHWLSEATFSVPPQVHAEVWGKWHSPELIGATGKIFATNFVAHQEHVDSFAADLDYTNRVFHVSDARLVKGGEYATLGLAEADLRSKEILVTNVLAAVTPDLIRRVCLPHKVRWLELIQFEKPAAIKLNGSLKIGDPLGTRLRFQVLGEGFHFTNMVANRIGGTVTWQGRHVDLTNIQAALYQTGTLVGSCAFDWDPQLGTDFSCNLTAKDVDLPALAAGLTGRTNKLEGMLDGNLIMDRSNTHDRRTWKGLGDAHVHNALLWDIRIFGIFSPILNAISAGAGQSRAYEANANYVITNGVVATDDLTVRSTGFRLLYRGTVDTVDKQMNARMEAELLRDTRVLGPVLSTLLSPLSKLFEYKVTGNLHDPKSEPVFIPAPLMSLLRPFHALKPKASSGANPETENPAPASPSSPAPPPADPAKKP